MAEIKVDDREVRKELSDMSNRLGSGFVRFWQFLLAYMRVRTDLMFRRLKHGGVFRGVRWAPFKSEFVPRGGTRLAQGKRVRNLVPANQASLMQDTLNLRRNAANFIFLQSSRRVTFGSNIDYGEKQQRLRRFLFWNIPEDLEWATDRASRFVTEGQ